MGRRRAACNRPATGRLAGSGRRFNLVLEVGKLDGDEDDAQDDRQRGRGNPVNSLHDSVPCDLRVHRLLKRADRFRSGWRRRHGGARARPCGGAMASEMSEGKADGIDRILRRNRNIATHKNAYLP